MLLRIAFEKNRRLKWVKAKQYLQLINISFVIGNLYTYVYASIVEHDVNYSYVTILTFIFFIFQPAGEHMSPGRGPGVGLPPGLTQVPAATTVVHQPADRLQLLYQDKPANLNNNTVSQQHQPIANQNNVNLAGHNHVTRDDGSSGYGSPDSETFEVPQ